MNLTGVGEPERLQGAHVTYNLFETLGITPTLGRSFLAEEDQPGRNDVAIISNRLWQRRFGGDPAMLNQTIALDGQSYTVVGVMPPGFSFLREADVYSPLAFPADELAPTNHGFEYLVVVGRLKDGVNLEHAQAEMSTLADSLRPQYYSHSSDWSISVEPLREHIVGEFKLALLVVLAAVGCVLLVACANVANLLLARASARKKEVALRTALGATRFRIVRQLLTESVMLAIVGGALGLLLAFIGIRALVFSIPDDITGYISGWKDIGINFQLLSFNLCLSVVTGLIFGLAPALQTSKLDLNETLKEGGRSGTESAKRRLMGRALVVVEVGLSVVLLAAAGLLIKSFVRLQHVDPGFDPQNILTMQVSLPGSKYKDPRIGHAFFDQAIQEISALPSVEAAAVGDNPPMSGNNWNASFAVEGLKIAADDPSPHGDPHVVGPDFFKVMRIPLLSGRYFSNADGADSLPVCIVDKTLADEYWPEQNPLGKRIAVYFEGRDGKELHWRQVVGVVGHVKQYGLDGKSKVQYYFPMNQTKRTDLYVMVRTTSNPTSITSAVRAAIQHVDPDQPVARVMTMDQIVASSTLQKRFSMWLLTIFSSLTLLLAAVGVYGVMSYSVSQRTQEIGIRMALGASRGNVLKMIVRQGFTITGIGITVGLGGAYLATNVIQSLLFGVGAHDPGTFLLISVILSGVALVACLIPALRATRVDPLIALRYE